MRPGRRTLVAARLMHLRSGNCIRFDLGSFAGPMKQGLRILIVDANPLRSAIIEEGLRESGLTDLVRIGAPNGLVPEIERHDPDVVVIDLEDPSRDALADMFLVSRHV